MLSDQAIGELPSHGPVCRDRSAQCCLYESWNLDRLFLLCTPYARRDRAGEFVEAERLTQRFLYAVGVHLAAAPKFEAVSLPFRAENHAGVPC